MRKTAVIMLCTIFLAGSAADARPGLTAGFHSGLATDGGPFVRTLNDKSASVDMITSEYAQNTGTPPSSINIEQSKRTIPDVSCSLQYEFRSGFFLRSGVDFAVLASGKNISYRVTSADYNTTTSYKFSSSEQGVLIPLYAGFSLYPGRSPVGIYGAIGVAAGNCTASRSERSDKVAYDSATMMYTYSHTEWRTKSTSAPVAGLSALIGIEANLWKHVSLTIEYVFNDISDAKIKGGDIETFDSTGTSSSTRYKYIEHIGFPSQLIRFGARFTL